MLLAFDTATPLVTVALHDGEDVVAERTSTQPMKHGEQLAPPHGRHGGAPAVAPRARLAARGVHPHGCAAGEDEHGVVEQHDVLLVGGRPRPGRHHVG